MAPAGRLSQGDELELDARTPRGHRADSVHRETPPGAERPPR
jgi:hypothetical protein